MAKGKVRNRELEAAWRERLARQQTSGLTVRQFCREAGWPESAFHYWKRELQRRDGQSAAAQRKPPRQGPPALLPVTIGQAAPAPIEVSLPGGATLRVADGCDATLLKRVIGALEEV
jgi:transposase-like protein